MTRTDSELGRSLMTERGMQWLHAHSADPYALLLRAEDEDRAELARRIGELGPLHRSRNGAWVTANFALGAEVLTHPSLVPRTPALLGHNDVFPRPSVVPTPSASAVQRVCDEALHGVNGEVDLAADVIRPVLTVLAGDLVDVLAEERFAGWCAAAAITLDAVLCPPRLADARALLDAVAGLRALLPEPDMMLVCVAGVEMAANLVANTMRALLDQPGRWREVVSDNALAGDALDRTLRHDPPVRLDSRIASADFSLAGTPIAAGDEVVVHVEGANRDAGFPLAGGPHADLLLPIVRTWASALLRSLAANLPNLRVTGPVVTRLRAPVTHAIVRLPVTA